MPLGAGGAKYGGVSSPNGLANGAFACIVASIDGDANGEGLAAKRSPSMFWRARQLAIRP